MAKQFFELGIAEAADCHTCIGRCDILQQQSAEVSNMVTDRQPL
jgi:hypothetical protein